MVIDLTSFNSILNFAQGHGYLLIFLIMIVEGPIITTAAAFAASLGYFNVWIIFLLAFMGDVVGDAIVYSIGYFGRRNVIDKYDNFFNIKKSTLDGLEEHFKNHLGKTLFIVKMTPLAVPGLMLAGASKVPVKRYALWNALIILPKTIFFTALGYFFGVFANSILGSYKKIEYYILALVIGIILIYWLSRKISEKIVRKKN